jgi:hypothetical protein
MSGYEFRVWRLVDLSKDPNLYETLLEDLAAVAGIGIAAVGVIASSVSSSPGRWSRFGTSTRCDYTAKWVLAVPGRQSRLAGFFPSC